MNTPVALLVGLALLAGNGFFVAAEFSLLAARRARIEQLADQGDRRARHAAAGIRELSLMLAGAQLGITICSLGLGAVAEPALAQLLEEAMHTAVELPENALHAIGFTVALTIVVFLHMVVGEMAPKSWAISHPERSALTLAGPFRGFALLVRPLIGLLNAAANSVVRLGGVEPQDERALAHSPADLLLLLEESVTHGTIPADDHRLLTRSLELSRLDATTAMTPRHAVVSVDADQPLDTAATVAHETGRTRVVVYDSDPDHVIGIVHAKDILLHDTSPPATTPATVRDVLRPPLVTTEDRTLANLLVDMRAQRQHLAVVHDPQGNVTGIVTLEDVLEQLIGDFDDETDSHTRGDGHQPSY